MKYILAVQTKVVSVINNKRHKTQQMSCAKSDLLLALKHDYTLVQLKTIGELELHQSFRLNIT